MPQELSKVCLEEDAGEGLCDLNMAHCKGKGEEMGYEAESERGREVGGEGRRREDGGRGGRTRHAGWVGSSWKET